jgi:hypothetical protein
MESTAYTKLLPFAISPVQEKIAVAWESCSTAEDVAQRTGLPFLRVVLETRDMEKAYYANQLKCSQGRNVHGQG